MTSKYQALCFYIKSVQYELSTYSDYELDDEGEVLEDKVCEHMEHMVEYMNKEDGDIKGLYSMFDDAKETICEYISFLPDQYHFLDNIIRDIDAQFIANL